MNKLESGKLKFENKEKDKEKVNNRVNDEMEVIDNNYEVEAIINHHLRKDAYNLK